MILINLIYMLFLIITFLQESVGILLSKCLDKGLAPFNNEAVKKGNKIMHSLHSLHVNLVCWLLCSLCSRLILFHFYVFCVC